jgi:hypothetical protein
VPKSTSVVTRRCFEMNLCCYVRRTLYLLSELPISIRSLTESYADLAMIINCY